MPEPFSAKLELALKALSVSRGRLAADLGVDKSVVARWLKGSVRPSGHNLSLLTSLVAKRVPTFTILDWDRSLASLATLLGADLGALAGAAARSEGLQFAILDQVRSTTVLRGGAYEGFFRSTRPFLTNPGRFLHDHCMIAPDASGMLRLRMGTAGTFFEGWVMPLQNQLFCIAEDLTSGALFFCIMNGVGVAKAEVIDGLALGSALDNARTPTAMAMVLERIGDLSGDAEADERHFLDLAARDPVAPEGSISPEMGEHLARDIGPSELARGGDWLLRMPLSRSMARGPVIGG